MLISRLRENGVQSFCVVPLTTALRPPGSHGLRQSAEQRDYHEDEVAFMQEVAKQVAVAVDNVLHDESARCCPGRSWRASATACACCSTSTTPSSPIWTWTTVFASVSTSLQRVIQHDGCSLMLYEPETGHYRCHVLKRRENESFVEEGQADHSVTSPGCHRHVRPSAPAVFSEHDLKTVWAESKIAQHLLAEGVKSFCSIPAALSRSRAGHAERRPASTTRCFTRTRSSC